MFAKLLTIAGKFRRIIVLSVYLRQMSLAYSAFLPGDICPALENEKGGGGGALNGGSLWFGENISLPVLSTVHGECHSVRGLGTKNPQEF